MALNFLEAWRAEIPKRLVVPHNAAPAQELQQEAEDLIDTWNTFDIWNVLDATTSKGWKDFLRLGKCAVHLKRSSFCSFFDDCVVVFGSSSLQEAAMKEIAAQLPLPLYLRFYCLTHPFNTFLRYVR